jgi:Rrf2 family protein
MIGKTSLLALRTLLLLAREDRRVCLSPRRLAEMLGESPTYLAKVVRHLVRSGILEAEKGAKGGVRLVRNPSDITLLAVVEACQGYIVGDYCRSTRTESMYCNFHRAAQELHAAITGVLASWTLEKLLEKPYATGPLPDGHQCLMGGESLAGVAPQRLTHLTGIVS